MRKKMYDVHFTDKKGSRRDWMMKIPEYPRCSQQEDYAEKIIREKYPGAVVNGIMLYERQKWLL